MTQREWSMLACATMAIRNAYAGYAEGAAFWAGRAAHHAHILLYGAGE
jgi:hypothetical protein